MSVSVNELNNLRNYKKINELEYELRKQYKMELPREIMTEMERFIKYDEKIESTCEDCGDLLLIDDKEMCQGKYLRIDPNRFLVRYERVSCNKYLCGKCLKNKTYGKYSHIESKCCDRCYKNGVECKKCYKKIGQALSKCNLCNKRICRVCTEFTLFKKTDTKSYHKGYGNYGKYTEINNQGYYCCKDCLMYKKRRGKMVMVMLD